MSTWMHNSIDLYINPNKIKHTLIMMNTNFDVTIEDSNEDEIEIVKNINAQLLITTEDSNRLFENAENNSNMNKEKKIQKETLFSPQFGKTKETKYTKKRKHVNNVMKSVESNEKILTKNELLGEINKLQDKLGDMERLLQKVKEETTKQKITDFEQMLLNRAKNDYYSHFDYDKIKYPIDDTIWCKYKYDKSIQQPNEYIIKNPNYYF